MFGELIITILVITVGAIAIWQTLRVEMLENENMELSAELERVRRNDFALERKNKEK